MYISPEYTGIINLFRYNDVFSFKLIDFSDLAFYYHYTYNDWGLFLHSIIKVRIIEQDPCMREIFDTNIHSFAIDTKMTLETVLVNANSTTTKNENFEFLPD